MRQTIILHLTNEEEPFIAEIEQLPDSNDRFIIIENLRHRDGTGVRFLDGKVTTVLLPWHRIALIQVLPSTDVDDVIGFVRE